MHKWDWEYISRGNGWMKEMKLRDKNRESRVSESSHTGSANHRWRALRNRSASYIPPNQWTCIMPWANLLSEAGRAGGWVGLTRKTRAPAAYTCFWHNLQLHKHTSWCIWLLRRRLLSLTCGVRWGWLKLVWNLRQAGIQLTRQAEGEWMSAGCVGTEPLPEILAGTDSLWPCAVFTP